VQELFIERASRRASPAISTRSRVRVLPGMQAAFIDIGLERTAFLHVSDIVQPADAEGAVDAPRTDSIRELVGEGADILVQVLKDPLAQGRAAHDVHHDSVAIPRLHAVRRGVGVSAAIETEASRAAIARGDAGLRSARWHGGYIVRTAARGC